MTRYGFLIDQDTCIGCHACTVACKAEHDVPLGVNRTWVKYIESGTFPDVSRHFAVMRCNHCDERAMRDDLPDRRAVPPRQRDRRLRHRQLHRLQVVHERLPLRRALHRSRRPHRPEVQLLRPPRRGRVAAVVRGGVPDAVDRRRRPRRPQQQDQSHDRRPRRRGAGARAGHAAQAVLQGRRPGGARSRRSPRSPPTGWSGRRPRPATRRCLRSKARRWRARPTPPPILRRGGGWSRPTW